MRLPSGYGSIVKMSNANRRRRPYIVRITTGYDTDKQTGKTKQVIGSTRVFLEGIDEYCRFRECNLGNFVTDSFVDYVSIKILTNIKNNNKKNSKKWILYRILETILNRTV